MEPPLSQEILNHRKTDYGVHPLILGRWSPRSMSGEPINDKDLMSLLEAAHWAPSSFNAQPWRFIYAHRETSEWDLLFPLLVPFNQKWVCKAAALVLIVSRTRFEHNEKPSQTHSFDTGAAWGYLALQGYVKGLVVHGMQGFDYTKAKQVCKVPSDYQIEAMVAIGKRGKKEDLPQEMQKKETPSTRKPLSEIIMRGTFKG